MSVRLPRPAADFETRRRIVEEVERSCLVEASAGTGKTTLLVRRILTLFRRGVAPEGLVAITFTEKAAAELQSRLRDDLERAAHDPEEPEAGRLAAALAELDRASVTTIHSFCSRILRDDPVSAGLSPGFHVLDAVAARRLFDDTWEAWLGQELARPESRLREPLAWGARLEAGPGGTGLREMARALYQQRDLLAPFLAVAGEPRGLRRERLARLRDGMSTRLESIEAGLSACRAPGVDKAHISIAEALVRQRKLLERLCSDLEGQARRTLPELKWPKIGNLGQKANWPAEALQELRTASTEFVEFLEAMTREVRGTVALEAALALAEFLAVVEAAKARVGGVDFDDLLIGARRLLRDHPATRAELQRTFTHLLLDEFQDTDPIQAEIVFLLSADDPSQSDWRKVRPVPGKLFIVGDPKQSIYRFRRADITLYTECQEILAAAGGARETIEVNFRTQGPVIDWVNRIFDPLMAPEQDPVRRAFRPPYSLLLPHRPEDPEPRLPAVVNLPLDPGATTADARRADEALRLAAFARRLVVGREGRVIDRETGNWRAPLWGDLAILFRAYGSLRIYEDALRDAGIPYRVDGGRLYFARSEVQAMLAVLRAIDNPNDRLALVAALRSPFFAFSDDALLLAHLREPLGWAATIPPADAELARAFERLFDWHRRRHELGPARLVEEILADCRALEFHALKPDGEQRVANLLKIADEARRFSRDVGAVRAFLRHLEDRETAVGSEAEGESPIQEEGDRQHLHLLSIHKSKGLEFPIVILADLAHAGGASPRVLVDRPGRRLALALSLGGKSAYTPGWDELALIDKAQAEAEAVRLFYVAATRARDQLILPRPAGGRRDGLLGLLDTWEPGAADIVEVAPEGEDSAAPLLRLEIPGVPDAGPDPLEVAAGGFERRRAEIMAALPPRPILLAPSALGRTGESPDSGAEPGFAPGTAGTRLGALVHEILEANASTPAALEALIAARGGAEGGEEIDAEVVRRLVAAAADSPVTARLARARSVRREAPFLSRHALPDGRVVLLDGRVDLAFEEADGWVVVDYKTDRVPPGGVEELLRRHRGQALGYALGVGQSLAPAYARVEGAPGSRTPRPETAAAAAPRVKEIVFVFLRAGETRTLAVTPNLIAEAAERLALAASQAGGFTQVAEVGP